MFGLSKQNILTDDEIKKAFSDVQKKVSTYHFTFLLASRDAAEAGMCVILAKKNIKKATKRNLCRRLFKESFRCNKHRLEGKSIIVLAKKPAALATKESLWESIAKFYQNLEA
jgi:ribonuclease P protein component